MEEDGAGHHAATQPCAPAGGARVKDQDGGNEFYYACTNPAPGLHAQLGKQLYGLFMTGEFKIQGLEHNTCRQQP